MTMQVALSQGCCPRGEDSLSLTTAADNGDGLATTMVREGGGDAKEQEKTQLTHTQ